MGDKDSRTEEATPKKIEDARKKGQIAKSPDLNAGVSLFVFTLLLGSIGNFLFKNMFLFMKNMLSIDSSINMKRTTLKNLSIRVIFTYVRMFLPVAGIAIFIGVIVNLLQVGFLYTKDPLKPDIKKLNPIQGFKNIFSKKAMVNLIKNLLKLVLIFYMTYRNLSKNTNEILNFGEISLSSLFFVFISFLKNITLNIVIVMFLLGVVDLAYQKREHKKDLKMTKDEVKEEFKQMEGNQEIKAARRQKQRELAMSRMMSSIKDSTVVVTNPTHLALAIRYDKSKDTAPVIVAKGADHVAMKIREKAKEHEIAIVENKPVARALYKSAEIGDSVPVELYQAVAEILVIVYEMDKYKNKKGRI